MIHNFFYNRVSENIIESVFRGVLIHDFGGDIADIILKRFMNKSLADIGSISEINECVRRVIV